MSHMSKRTTDQPPICSKADELARRLPPWELQAGDRVLRGPGKPELIFVRATSVGSHWLVEAEVARKGPLVKTVAPTGTLKVVRPGGWWERGDGLWDRRDPTLAEKVTGFLGAIVSAGVALVSLAFVAVLAVIAVMVVGWWWSGPEPTCPPGQAPAEYVPYGPACE